MEGRGMSWKDVRSMGSAHLGVAVEGQMEDIIGGAKSCVVQEEAENKVDVVPHFLLDS